MLISSVLVKASVLTEVVERMRSSKVAIHVSCTVLKGQGNRCSTRYVRSEGLAGQRREG